MRLLALAAVAVGASTLTACGGSAGDATARADVAGAASKTAAVKSYRTTIKTKMKLPNTSQEVTFTGDGIFDPKGRRGRMTLDLSQLKQLQAQNGSPYSFGFAQLVMSGSDMYMRIPFLKEIEPSLKPWVKVNVDEGGRAGGIDFSSFLQFGQGGNPTQALEYLRAAGKVEKVGSDEIRGEQTTHYTAKVDLTKVANAAPAKNRESLRRAVNRVITLTGQRTIPVEIWIGKDGLVRREAYDEKLRLGGATTTLSSSLELYDFGTKVIAPLPPAADVTDLSGGLNGAQS
jgi:hypothetical protein